MAEIQDGESFPEHARKPDKLCCKTENQSNLEFIGWHDMRLLD